MAFHSSIGASVRVCTVWVGFGWCETRRLSCWCPTDVLLESSPVIELSSPWHWFLPDPGTLWWFWLCVLGHYLASGWNLAPQHLPKVSQLAGWLHLDTSQLLKCPCQWLPNPSRDRIAAPNHYRPTSVSVIFYIYHVALGITLSMPSLHQGQGICRASSCLLLFKVLSSRLWFGHTWLSWGAWHVHVCFTVLHAYFLDKFTDHLNSVDPHVQLILMSSSPLRKKEDNYTLLGYSGYPQEWWYAQVKVYINTSTGISGTVWNTRGRS